MKIKLRISLDIRSVLIRDSLTIDTTEGPVDLDTLGREHQVIEFDTKGLDESERKWLGEHLSPCKYEDEKTFLTIFTRSEDGHMKQVKFSNATQTVVERELKELVAADKAAKETFQKK